AAYPIYCMANGLNVRSSNSTSSDSLGKLNIGDKVDAVERNDDWYKITYNNVTAYVSRDFVTANANEATFTRLENPEKLNVVEAKKDSQVVLRKYPVIAEDSYGPVFKGTDTVATLTKIGENADKTWFIVSYDADGEGAGAAVEYYLSVGSAARELFGLSGNSGNGVG
ncbi:MAG: SH3 domain-containing protein, partial [Clostridia bacterium]|nr:SH3 domain-containing protein [Clostridia bacterium]